jgi:hypothetical protein
LSVSTLHLDLQPASKSPSEAGFCCIILSAGRGERGHFNRTADEHCLLEGQSGRCWGSTAQYFLPFFRGSELSVAEKTMPV